MFVNGLPLMVEIDPLVGWNPLRRHGPGELVHPHGQPLRRRALRDVGDRQCAPPVKLSAAWLM